MFQRIGAAAYKKDLTNTEALCARLGNPEKKLRCVHIAGTNGKGTVTHLLAAALQIQGLKVGVYTSPHFKDFRERIKINGVFVSEQYVINFVETHKAFIEELQPSFFELSTVMAFDYMAQQKVDIAIIETGLGGRLDSTNVIAPLLSVITNISFDHQQFLGDTLPLIAEEKAGIIKPKTPVVIGERQSETETVFIKKALENDSPIQFASDEINVDYLAPHFYKFKQTDGTFLWGLESELMGNYQSRNLATAFVALQSLEKILDTTFKLENIQSAFSKVKTLTWFKGRWEKLSDQPLTFAESAHNEAGIKAFCEQLNAFHFHKLHLVFGMVKDKSPEAVLSVLPKNAVYYFAKPDIPRGLDAEILQKTAADFQLYGNPYPSVKDALNAAQKAAQKGDLVIVTGSMFVVAEVIG